VLRREAVPYIVIWQEFMGKSTDQIAAEHDLTLSDVYAALVYYYDHREEIDKAIQDSNAFVETLRCQTLSKLAEKSS